MHLGTVLPSLEGATEWMNGGPVTAADLAGRPVLVHFWAVSCQACRQILPALLEWERVYSPRGLQFVGIHQPRTEADLDPEVVRGAVAAQGLTHPVALDGDRIIGPAWGNKFIPAFYLFDSAGRLAHYQAGIRGRRMLQQAIERVLPAA